MPGRVRVPGVVQPERAAPSAFIRWTNACTRAGTCARPGRWRRRWRTAAAWPPACRARDALAGPDSPMVSPGTPVIAGVTRKVPVAGGRGQATSAVISLVRLAIARCLCGAVHPHHVARLAASTTRPAAAPHAGDRLVDAAPAPNAGSLARRLRAAARRRGQAGRHQPGRDHAGAAVGQRPHHPQASATAPSAASSSDGDHHQPRRQAGHDRRPPVPVPVRTSTGAERRERATRA